MKKTVLFAFTFVMLIFLWGCPYKSPVALGPAVEKVQSEYIGSWVPATEATIVNPSFYVISEFDSVHYDIEHHQFNEDEKGYHTKNYVAHTTSIDGFVFMHLVESGTKDFLLHRLVLTPSGMTLFEVTDNIDEQFDSSEKLRQFFIQNMRLSFFYNRDEVELVKKP
ncbi:MAG: hypothetical protein K9G41_05345 [Flavobacteriales bacterium]|nr:hypothetical protein [Flavobacteriales bacterium]